MTHLCVDKVLFFCLDRRMKLQRTLVVLKPDAVCRSVMGEIMTRFERAGYTIVGAKMMSPDRDFLYHHYETIGTLGTRANETVLNNTIDMLMESPVLAMVVEGAEAVENVRKMVGKTEPKGAQPGTIRGDYAHVSYGYADSTTGRVNNLVHASGDAEEAVKEIAHWFSDAELFDYAPGHGRFTR